MNLALTGYATAHRQYLRFRDGFTALIDALRPDLAAVGVEWGEATPACVPFAFVGRSCRLRFEFLTHGPGGPGGACGRVLLELLDEDGRPTRALHRSHLDAEGVFLADRTERLGSVKGAAGRLGVMLLDLVVRPVRDEGREQL